MLPHEVKDTLAQIDLLEKCQLTVTSILAKISDAAQCDHILSREQCMELSSYLNEYFLLLEPIEKAYGEELPSENISELKEALQAHLRKYRMDEALEDANRFYLLGTANAELLKELDEQKVYTHTKEFIEEQARETYGLLYDGEILFVCGEE